MGTPPGGAGRSRAHPAYEWDRPTRTPMARIVLNDPSPTGGSAGRSIPPAAWPVPRPGIPGQPDRRDRHPRLDHLLRPAEDTRTPARRRGPPTARRTPQARRHRQHETGLIAEIVVTEIIQAAKGPR